MTDAWKKLDLEGGGLQSASLQLAQRLKKRLSAYLFWLLFPFGGHAFYLSAPIHGLSYIVLSVIIVLSYHFLAWAPALIPLGLMILLAAYDLFWIDRRLTSLNKTIRMAVYMRKATGAPSNFRGRYSDDNELDTYMKEKDTEKAGHAAPTSPISPRQKSAKSFAQQEVLLRELAKGKSPKKSPKKY